MVNYQDNTPIKLPDIEIKEPEKPKFQWSGWWNLIFKKEIKFTWKF